MNYINTIREEDDSMEIEAKLTHDEVFEAFKIYLALKGYKAKAIELDVYDDRATVVFEGVTPLGVTKETYLKRLQDK